MKVTKELIERFFRNECSPEEQAQVKTFFELNPDELAPYLDETEWENFEANPIDPALSKQLFETVRHQTIRKAHIIRTIRKIAVAASVLLIAGLRWMYLGIKKQELPVAKTETKTNDSISFVTKREINKTGKDKTVQLPDGSLITLANNSEVDYQFPFTNSRNITLVGKALFKVAKDKTKPFMVTSGKITTTALGTMFTVTANNDNTSMVVRLYEGKVVVKALDQHDWRMKKDYFLNPGQEFVYNNQALAIVRSFNNKRTNTKKASDELFADEPIIPQNAGGSWYMFNNQSLGDVFDQLAFTFNVHIVYNKEDVKHKYFVGRFNKSDSLDVILKYITIANNLKVNRKENTYYITNN